MKDFLISYNSADKAWAEWIAWQLEDAGYQIVIQAWGFLPGENFVLVLSLDFLSSKFVNLNPRGITIARKKIVHATLPLQKGRDSMPFPLTLS